ncbi:hypothetical protein PINS_up009478 [Pythium insidiosum]|nr:hypothetical protein PINS_up009478 [Pythium insidiosum]
MMNRFSRRLSRPPLQILGDPLISLFLRPHQFPQQLLHLPSRKRRLWTTSGETVLLLQSPTKPPSRVRPRLRRIHLTSLDEFTTKATISAPAPSSTSAPAVNPFDFSVPAPAQSQKTAPPAQATPFNPFDF